MFVVVVAGAGAGGDDEVIILKVLHHALLYAVIMSTFVLTANRENRELPHFKNKKPHSLFFVIYFLHSRT